MHCRLLAAIVVVLVASLGVGCDTEAGGASAGMLETLLKREIATALLEEGAEPTEAQIADVASKLGVSCEPADAPDYACAIDYGGELGERHCTVRSNRAVTRLTSVRCGGATAPVAGEQFTDCATVGDVVAVDDPAGDVNENSRPLPPERAATDALAKADLRAVRVAATTERRCVQWEAAAPVTPGYGLNFWVYPSGGGDQQSISLALSLTAGQPPEIGIGPYGSMSGNVGVDGKVVSVLIEAEDLPEVLRGALDGPFMLAAHSAWVVGRTHPDQAYGDDLNYQAGRPSYP